MSNPDLWQRLAAPFDAASIRWRQQGRVVKGREGFVARYVAYVTSELAWQRLDQVAPGWTLQFRLLESVDVADRESKGELHTTFVCHCRLTVEGVARDGIGEGTSPKAASSDAFKRAALAFGIGHDAKSLPPLWVAMDGDGKFAKPLKAPSRVYLERTKASGRVGERASGKTQAPPTQPKTETPDPDDAETFARLQFIEFNNLGEDLGVSGAERLRMMREAGAEKWSDLSPQARAELVEAMKRKRKAAEATDTESQPAGNQRKGLF